MPTSQIRIPDLVPGKRYRMVVSTNDTSETAPSIEFVVPTSPRLLSTYTPTCTVTTINYPQTGGDIIGYVDVYGPDPAPYTVSTSTPYSGTTKGGTFRNGDSTYTNYKMTIASGSVPSKGQTFSITGASTGSAPYYYDWLVYTVTSVSGQVVYATAVLGKTTSYSAKWLGQKGNPFTDIATTVGSKAPTLSWSITTSETIDPSAPYLRTDPIYSAIVPASSETYVDLNIPIEISYSLANYDTVVDIPIFMYKKNGQYYYFDDTLVNDSKVGGILNPQTLSSKPSPIPMKKRNEKVNSDASNRDYRFTIARYTFTGTSWTGKWLQTEDRFINTQVIEDVIMSQSAVRV